MERAALIENIQQKIAKIENKEVLCELESMIDEIVFFDRDTMIPLHVQESITLAAKQLEEGKGIPHEEVWNEIQERRQKTE